MLEVIHTGEGAGKVKVVGEGEGRGHEKKIFTSHLLQINLMDYYNGEGAPEDEWVWNLEEEKKLSRVSDAILYSLEEPQKVGWEEGLFLEEEKVMVEENGGVGGGEDSGKFFGQEYIIQDVEGEDSAEDDTKDINWGRRFEAEMLRKEVSDWLAGQRTEQEDYRAGRVDALDLTGSRLMELVRQGWEENLDQWAQQGGLKGSQFGISGGEFD